MDKHSFIINSNKSTTSQTQNVLLISRLSSESIWNTSTLIENKLNIWLYE
jgi:hypothetical protein